MEKHTSPSVLERYSTVMDALATLHDPKLALFAQNASALLLTSTDTLVGQGILHDDNAVARGVAMWIQDNSHGVKHSWHVFEGAKTLRDLQPEYQSIPDRDLFLRAVLHDLGEFMPIIGRDGKPVSSTINKSRLHPALMHRAITLWGSAAGIANPPALARDILYHDYSYRKPSPRQAESFQKELSEAGRLFIDADRFAGAGPLLVHEEGIRTSVADAIARNRSGSLGTWYFLRPDVTADDRIERWKPRSKGYFDGASALFSEYFGFPRDLANTELGKSIVDMRQNAFTQEVLNFYGTQYDDATGVLTHPWKAGDVRVGLKEETPLWVTVPEEIRSLSLHEAANHIVSMPVTEKPVLSQRSYYGYSLFYEGSWYDPSIVRFETKQALEDALRESIESYKDGNTHI